MAEPWLDSLSEDWNSQPRSSPPSLPKTSSNNSVKAGAQIKSKIPRPNSAALVSSPSNSLRKTRSAPTKSKRILTERSDSDINIPLHSSARPADSTNSQSPSLSSNDSVVRRGTVERNAQQSSLSAQQKNGRMVEWQKLVMKGNNGNENPQDLFAPVGLEQMFRAPSPGQIDESFESPKKSPFLALDLESMPSSPPPWPKDHRGLKQSLRTKSNLNMIESLDVVHEQEEDQMEQEVNEEFHDRIDGSHCGGTEIEMELPDPQKLQDSNQDMDFLSGKDQPMDDRKSKTAPAPSSIEPSHDDLNQHNRRIEESMLSEQGTSRQPSSSNTDFSPVFISKHNTVDGHIDYAAIDPSDSQAIDRYRQAILRQSQGECEIRSDGIVEQDDHDGLEYAEISEFVNVTRGGYSEDESFKSRPLSPSASSSIVPSDSVSQVHANHPNRDTIVLKPLHNSRREATLSTSQDPENPVSSILPVHVEHSKKDADEMSTGVSHNVENERCGTIPSDIAVVKETSNYQNDHASNGTRDSSVDTVIKREESTKELASLKDETIEESLENQTVQHEFHDLKANTSERSQAIQQSVAESSAPTLFDHPDPNRQHILYRNQDDAAEMDTMALAQDQHRKIQAIIGKKRKDARYDDYGGSVGPEEIAKREILQPRNSNAILSRNYQGAAHSESFLESLVSNLSDEQIVREHMEESEIPPESNEEDDIRALASEVATLRMKAVDSETGDFRKQSLSTQDYIDEATKIMELIRSKRRPQNDLSNLNECESETAALNSNSGYLTPQTFSRPPSREGGRSAWRTKDDIRPDDHVLDHLKRYQETGNESIMTSAFLSLDLASEQDIQIRMPLNEKDNVPELNTSRSYGNGRKRSYSDSDVGLIANEPSPAQMNTQNSNQSAGSSNQTAKSATSFKNRTIANIGPDKVSHLIGAEQAGMRYDGERQAWVRCKISTLQSLRQEHPSSSAGTVDDPLGHIPDLSIHESERQILTGYKRFQGSQEGDIPCQSLHEELVVETEQEDIHRQNFEPQAYHDTGGISDARQITPDGDLKISRLEGMVEDSSFTHGIDDEHIESLEERQPQTAEGLLDENGSEDTTEIITDQAHSEKRFGVGTRTRREVSVMFSSPPVSKEWPPHKWEDSSELEAEESEIYDLDGEGDPGNDQAGSRQEMASVVPRRRRQDSMHQPLGSYPLDRALSLSRIDEQHELSFVETRPDGRTWSLSLSISTPGPVRPYHTASSSFRDGLRTVGVHHSLSPLSEFSFHQDDSRHLRSRMIADARQPLAITGNTIQSAVVVNSLVEKLTDVEPDEPYWDWMRGLKLHSKDLENLHTLDQFCPRLEELDIANNKLTQLNGVPSTIRHLFASSNALSGLTNWEHLTNLQYLDVSSNDIETLESLGDLVHLREIIADDNKISDLNGILDLDGLLSLDLRGNQIREVDFAGSELRRLSNMNLSENNLEVVCGLDYLSQLLEVDLSRNKLVRFPFVAKVQHPCKRLRSLSLDSNELDILDVTGYQNLHFISADNNFLSRIVGVSQLPRLETVSLRCQDLPTNPTTQSLESSLNDFCEVQNLYLSGNTLRSFPITVPFLNLRVLELAFTGLTALPSNFGDLNPNLRILNLNFNALKDLRPLRGISKISKLSVAGNRLNRLRRTLSVVQNFQELTELDLRDNPFSLGFYASAHDPDKKHDYSKVVDIATVNDGLEEDDVKLKHVLPLSDPEVDSIHFSRLDDDTKLRRRVYELLLATKARKLQLLDGLKFKRKSTLTKDDIWDKLMTCGVIEIVGSEGSFAHA